MFDFIIDLLCGYALYNYFFDDDDDDDNENDDDD